MQKDIDTFNTGWDKGVEVGVKSERERIIKIIQECGTQTFTREVIDFIDRIMPKIKNVSDLIKDNRVEIKGE